MRFYTKQASILFNLEFYTPCLCEAAGELKTMRYGPEVDLKGGMQALEWKIIG